MTLSRDQLTFIDFLWGLRTLDTKQIAELAKVEESDVWNARARKDNVVPFVRRGELG